MSKQLRVLLTAADADIYAVADPKDPEGWALESEQSNNHFYLLDLYRGEDMEPWTREQAEADITERMYEALAKWREDEAARAEADREFNESLRYED